MPPRPAKEIVNTRLSKQKTKKHLKKFSKVALAWKLGVNRRETRFPLLCGAYTLGKVRGKRYCGECSEA